MVVAKAPLVWRQEDLNLTLHRNEQFEVHQPGIDPWIRKIPLEEGMATRSSLLAWRHPRTEEPGGLQSMGLQKSQTRLG